LLDVLATATTQFVGTGPTRKEPIPAIRARQPVARAVFPKAGPRSELLMYRLAVALGAAALLPALAWAKTPPRPKPDGYVNLQNFRLQPKLPAATGLRKATKLVYVMGGGGIYVDSGSTIVALERLQGLAPTAYSLAYVGGIELDRLFSFGDDPVNTTKKSPLAPGLDVTPSNSLQLMSKVLSWVYTTYPGEARYLEIDGHGGGIFGIGYDTNSPYAPNDGAMPIQGLARALRDGSGGKPIDVVFFNACSMATIEALYEIAPSVRYVVGSENPIRSGATVVLDQPLLFERLAREGVPPAQAARELARQALRKFDNSVVSEVAIDTARLAPLVAQVAKLSAALLQGPASERDALTAAVQQTSTAYEVDLWALARNLERGAQTPAVKAAAHALFRLQAGATLYERSTVMAPGVANMYGNTGKGGGMSIYGGGRGKKFLDHGYAQTRFARATGWDKVLRAAGRDK
jgi:hypothetical protein